MKSKPLVCERLTSCWFIGAAGTGALLAAMPFAHASTPATAVSAAPATAPALPAAPTISSPSYSLGLTFGSQLHHGGLSTEVSMDALMRGIHDGLAGKQPTQVEKQAASQLLIGARESIADRNRTAAREFLAKNAIQPGVKSTASGLQYLVLRGGDPKGKTPDAGSQVTVTYRGKLLDGTEFDSSYAHGSAAIFRMNSIIRGWQEALRLMTPGAKWRIFVPPEMGYDAKSPPSIPPGSLLVYDIDLIKINAAGDFGPASNSNPASAAAKP